MIIKKILLTNKNRLTISGGRAPQGLCGAYYAVYYILKKTYLGKIKEFEKYFINEVGFMTCKELRRNKISCVMCVEKSAEFLEQIN